MRIVKQNFRKLTGKITSYPCQNTFENVSIYKRYQCLVRTGHFRHKLLITNGYNLYILKKYLKK